MSAGFKHSVDFCLESAIGSSGVSQADLNREINQTAGVLNRLKSARVSGSMPHVSLPDNQSDLAGIKETADRITSNAKDVVICGTGGSSLGGQALAQLAGWRAPGGAECAYIDDRPAMHFLDNIDATTLSALIDRLDLNSLHVIVISKSGSTAETLTQAILFLTAYESRLPEAAVSEHFTIITAPGSKNLRALADKYGMPVLDHPPDLGGRFSVMSCVGLLPAAIAGIDIAAVRRGAARTLDTALQPDSPKESPPAVGAAVSVALLRNFGINCSVFFAYGDRLERLSKWYVQLWAESLGKNGQGTTPLAALGPVDQHSQLQLFLDGPVDKLFTIVTVAARGKGSNIDAELALKAGVANLGGHTVGDLVESMQRATTETLAQKGHPVRTFAAEELVEDSLGGLMMHLMLETIIAGELLGVDPFDQPAVEQSKELARKLLTDF